MASDQVKDIIKRKQELSDQRTNWMSWWQELARYCIPRKAEITSEHASGTRFDTDIYDSTGRDSVKVFAAGLMGHLTNPSEEWFRLKTEDDNLMRRDGVKEFFSESVKKVNSTFNGSNFYQQLHELYLDTPVFGTAAFYSEQDDKDKIRYFTRAIREILFDEDDKGRVRTVYRVFELTAQQAFLRWKKEAGASVLKDIEDKKFDKMYDFIQCVGPRDVFDPKKKNKLNKPFHSIWINEKDKKKVDEGGFDEMPFHIIRSSKVDKEKHGFSFAMDVLPDIKMANRMRYIITRAAAKATDPPVMLPHEGYLLPLDFNPGATNYKLQKAGAGSDEEVQFLMHKGQINIGREDLLDIRDTIKKAFFTDMFLALAERDKTMTATEVLEIVEEKMLILGPFLGRLQTELLEPIIVRTFNMLLRSGELGELPPALINNPNYKIEYISLLAKAQRAAQVRTISNFLAIVQGIAALVPDVVDKIDTDMVIDQIADISGIDPKLLSDEETLKGKRDARAQQAEMAQQLAVAQAGADVVKTGSEAAKNITEGSKPSE